MANEHDVLNICTSDPSPLPCSCSQIAQTQAMLANEYGTASNIKSRVNRQSVLAAITSAQQRLKLYTKVGCGAQPCFAWR